MTPQSALAFVRALRPVAWPNDEFFRQLILWHGTGCRFVDKDNIGDPRYDEYCFAINRDLKAADPDSTPRPKPGHDMGDLERPKDPNRKPQPPQEGPRQRGGWLG